MSRREPVFTPALHVVEGVQCVLCGRVVPRRLITRHHLLPKQKGGKFEHTVPTCKPCHKQVHATYTNTELKQQFATVDQLRAAPLLQDFLRWIRKQRPDRNVVTRSSNLRRQMRQRRRR